jgi:hypothetical protein
MNTYARIFCVTVSFMCLALAALPIKSAHAQRFSWPEQSENLKALPANTSAQQLSSTMRAFTRSLGVRCSHCHVGDEGASLATYDFASDDKPAKRIAREMILMVQAINETHLANSESSHTVDVTCTTCHRGVSRPYPIERIIANTLEEEGQEEAVNTYKSMRDRHYGSFAYDFTVGNLARFADGLLSEDNQSDGIAFHRLNTELHPGSSQAWSGLAGGYAVAGDTLRAVSLYEHALVLNPADNRIVRALSGLQ